jgi:hypothetical protein
MFTIIFNDSLDIIKGRRSKGIQVYAKYYINLTEVLKSFNAKQGLDITKLYNRYGQEIPLSYRVQNTGLEVYY